MTYEEFKKKMVKLSEARRSAMEDDDFDTDEQLEQAMLELEKENLQYVDEWAKDVWVSMNMNKFGQSWVSIRKINLGFCLVFVFVQCCCCRSSTEMKKKVGFPTLGFQPSLFIKFTF